MQQGLPTPSSDLARRCSPMQFKKLHGNESVCSYYNDRSSNQWINNNSIYCCNRNVSVSSVRGDSTLDCSVASHNPNQAITEKSNRFPIQKFQKSKSSHQLIAQQVCPIVKLPSNNSSVLSQLQDLSILSTRAQAISQRNPGISSIQQQAGCVTERRKVLQFCNNQQP